MNKSIDELLIILEKSDEKELKKYIKEIKNMNTDLCIEFIKFLDGEGYKLDEFKYISELENAIYKYLTYTIYDYYIEPFKNLDNEIKKVLREYLDDLNVPNEYEITNDDIKDLKRIYEDDYKFLEYVFNPTIPTIDLLIDILKNEPNYFYNIIENKIDEYYKNKAKEIKEKIKLRWEDE